MSKWKNIGNAMQGEKVTAVEANCRIYRELICDMVERIHSERFLKQIYSILARHIQRTGD